MIGFSLMTLTEAAVLARCTRESLLVSVLAHKLQAVFPYETLTFLSDRFI